MELKGDRVVLSQLRTESYAAGKQAPENHTASLEGGRKYHRLVILMPGQPASSPECEKPVGCGVSEHGAVL